MKSTINSQKKQDRFQITLRKNPCIYITEEVLNEIKNTIGKIPAESGGLLLGNRKEGIITTFVYDSAAKTTGSTYQFNHIFLNRILRANPRLQILGYIHVHPPGARQLSYPDKQYFQAQFEHLDTTFFYTPIVISEADTGKFELLPYITFKDDAMNPVKGKLQVVDFSENQSQETRKLKDFSRIKDAVKKEIVEDAKVVIVGTGGSFSLIESLVRTGLRNLVLIDFDEVEESNIVRQGYFLDDCGKLKVNALTTHLKNINPDINIEKFNQKIESLSQLQENYIFGDADAALFLTDSFTAQAKGNELSIKHNIPAIFAGYYEGSKCCEIFFSIPEVTKACFRCAVSSRYKAQADAKNEIKASSQSNTIFHSQFLDSIIGMIAMAILHNDTEGYYFSNWFGDSFEHNFFQVRTHPDYGTEKGSLFERTLGNFPKSNAFIFNAIAQFVEVEKPPKYNYSCPDCQPNK